MRLTERGDCTPKSEISSKVVNLKELRSPYGLESRIPTPGEGERSFGRKDKYFEGRPTGNCTKHLDCARVNCDYYLCCKNLHNYSISVDRFLLNGCESHIIGVAKYHTAISHRRNGNRRSKTAGHLRILT